MSLQFTCVVYSRTVKHTFRLISGHLTMDIPSFGVMFNNSFILRRPDGMYSFCPFSIRFSQDNTEILAGFEKAYVQ